MRKSAAAVGKPAKEKINRLEDDAKAMAARLSQLRVEMERERAERERSRTATYLWSTSAPPQTGAVPTAKRGGPGSPAYTQSAYRHHVASKQSWQPPELQQNFASNRADHLNGHGSSIPPSSIAACEPSLLDGKYDEAKAAQDFQEALLAWRGPAAPCTATTSTTMSTGREEAELLAKKPEPCTIFSRLAIGHRSVEASLQAALHCVCENQSGGDAARGTSQTEDVSAKADSLVPLVASNPASDLDIISWVRHEELVVPQKLSVHEHDEAADEEEDTSCENILSISNLQLSQALTSQIRLPDAVHVAL